MTTRCAVIVTLDVAESAPEFEQTMYTVVKSMRDHFGSLLAEHRPVISLTFDGNDIDTIVDVELRILREQTSHDD